MRPQEQKSENQAARVHSDSREADQTRCTARQAMENPAPSNTAFTKTAAAGYIEAHHAAERAEVDAPNAVDPQATRPPKPKGGFTMPCWVSRHRCLLSVEMIRIGPRLVAQRRSPNTNARSARQKRPRGEHSITRANDPVPSSRESSLLHF